METWQSILFVLTIPVVFFVARTALTVLTAAVIWAGGLLHGILRRPDGKDSDQWLFSMLMGLTHTPCLALITAAYALNAVQWFFPDARILVVLSFVYLALAAFLGIRIICLLGGSFIFGPSIRTIMRSLQS